MLRHLKKEKSQVNSHALFLNQKGVKQKRKSIFDMKNEQSMISNVEMMKHLKRKSEAKSYQRKSLRRALLPSKSFDSEEQSSES